MDQSSRRISVADAFEQIQRRNAFLVDVRSSAEYAAAHAADVSVNIPVSEIAARKAELPTDRPILTICASGVRSRSAADTLRTLGFEDVSDVEGGFNQWTKAGLPVVVNRDIMPLDQQFRLILGGIVLILTLLGAFKSRRFLFGTGFIGTMLIITSLLGICPMMSALEQLPWNQVRKN